MYNETTGEWEQSTDSLSVVDGKATHTAVDGTVETFDVSQSGTGNPNNNNTTGDAGDIYVDESTGDVYTHNGTTWVQVAGDNLIIDEGDPNNNNTSGNEGDVYIDNSTGNTYVYNETTGEWEQNTDVLNVADGKVTHTAVDGTVETFDVSQSGTGNPNNNNTTGTAGDIYVDESTGDIYTHNGTTWVQVAGDNLIIDEGDPNDNNTSGNEGDVYIDNSTGNTYVYNETTGEWEQSTDSLSVVDGKATHTAVDGTVETFDVSQSGTGNPNNNNTTGTAGDIYVDESTGDVYTHNGTTWVQVAGDNLIIDEGDPNDNNTSGNEGDVYIDNSTGNTYVYNETTGEWEQSTDSLSVVDGKATHTAVDGTVETFDVSQSGTGNPNNNNTTGTAGDIYVDESTGDVYTHNGTTWVQVAGDNLIIDEGDPNDNNTSGNEGDVYIDNSTGNTYVYNETTGEWEQSTDSLSVVDGKATHTAVDGTVETFDVSQSGTGNPNNNNTTGGAGDIYVDESTGDIYTFVNDPDGDPTTDDAAWVQSNVGDDESQTILVSTTDKSELYYVSEAYLAANNQTAPTSTDADGWDPASLPAGIYAIDIVGGVVNNFENIVNSGPVTINGDTYTTVEEYLENIVSANESQTILVSTTDKSELYYVSEAYLAANNQTAPTSTDADGWDPASLPAGIYAIDIAGGVVNNFENIVNSGPVTINGDTYTTVEEYLENIVSANESQTILVSTTDKSELYYVSEAYLAANNQTAPTSTDADGWDPASLPAGIYAIDIAGGVVNNFENIVNSGPVTINGDTYTTVEEYLENIVSANESQTILVSTTDKSELYYVSEAYLAANNQTAPTSTDADGWDPASLPTGIYAIDIAGGVVNNFENIVNSGPVTINGDTYTTVEEYLENIVSANESQTILVSTTDKSELYYVSEAYLAANNHTAPTSTDADGWDPASLPTGIYAIDIAGGVVNNFENIVNSGPVTINGDTYTTVEEYLENIVSANESQTILVSTTDKSELYYVSEAYLAANNQTAPTSTDADGWDPASLPTGIYAIDIAGGVVNNFENIVNSGPVTINGDTYTTVEEYLENIVSANESQTILVSTTDKSELYYVSEAYLAANNQTAPTSTDADGWDPASLPAGIYAIDIAGGVVNNFENIVNSGPVTINGDTYTTVEEYLENIVSANESQTILVSTTDKSELYYVSEAYLAANNQTAPTSTDADGWDPASLPTGIYAIDIVGGVVNNFENIVNSGPVTINGDTYTTVEEYLENIVSANESQTILVSTTDKSELYYVSEAYLAANNQTAPTSTDADGWDPASLPTGIYAIDIAGGVVNNFENIVNSGPVTINGETFTTIEDYLESKEPWNVENTSTPAISNTENIYQKGKIGIGDFSGETTTESLDIKTGSARIREVNTNVGTIEAATTGQKDRVLVADANGIIKSLKATLPKFFFMPSVLIPVIAEQVPAGDTFGTIDLHAKYIDQFGTPQASSDTSLDVAIPVLPADELAYHITWYDEEVFENVAVSAAGVLTYDVIAGADIYEGSFMNIVFVVKED